MWNSQLGVTVVSSWSHRTGVTGSVTATDGGPYHARFQVEEVGGEKEPEREGKKGADKGEREEEVEVVEVGGVRVVGLSEEAVEAGASSRSLSSSSPPSASSANSGLLGS